MNTLPKIACCFGMGISAVSTTSVMAQQQARGEGEFSLEEIIVTAQKREERIQDVPIAVNAIAGDVLRSSGIDGLEDLKQLSPSFNYRPSVAGNLASIRGVGGDFSGPSNESPIAINFDDVYVGSDSGYFYPFFAVERIDVLSGPQGTLFGRNATGGVVNIILRQPSHDFAGEASVGYGNYDTSTGDLYVTGGLSSTLSADLAGSVRRQGNGYGTNLFNGRDVGQYDSDAVRASLAWEPTAATRIRFSADYNKYEGSTFGSHALFGRANSTVIDGGGPQDVNVDLQPVTEVKGYGFGLHLDQDLGFANLVSISGYRHVDKQSATDIDGGPNQGFAISNDERNRQFTQELRLDSSGNGPLTWVTGLYYFDYSGGYNPSRLTTPFFTISDVTNTLTTKAYAAFAQGAYAITPTTKLTLGGRYSWEERTAEGTDALGPVYPLQKLREKKPTWRVSLDQHFTENLMAYASYNRGFKSGGFNAINLAGGSFESETIDAYELGLKSELFDRSVRFNVAGFYYDYSNLQVTDIRTGVPVVTNAAAATIKGIEAQLTAVLAQGLTLDTGFTWTDAKYDRYPGANCVTFDPSASPATTPTNVVCDVSGRKLLRVPEYALSIAPRYAFDIGRLTGDLTVSYYYSSHQDLVFTDSAELSPSDRHTLNASFEIELPAGASVTFWGNNLLDEKQLSFISAAPLSPFSGHAFSAFYLSPLTYGVRLDWKF